MTEPGAKRSTGPATTIASFSLARAARRLLAQPQAPLAVAFDRHRAAIDLQAHDAGLRRDLERVGQAHVGDDREADHPHRGVDRDDHLGNLFRRTEPPKRMKSRQPGELRLDPGRHRLGLGDDDHPKALLQATGDVIHPGGDAADHIELLALESIHGTDPETFLSSAVLPNERAKTW